MTLSAEEIIPAIRQGRCKKLSIPGFLNASYFADELGNIYSLNNPREPKSVDKKMGNGLMWVTLFEREGYIRKMMVGDVIANTFLAEEAHEESASTVVYVDGDTENNAVQNLRWGTPQEQQNQLRQAHFDKKNPEQSKLTSGQGKRLQALSGSDDVVPFIPNKSEDPLLDQLHLLQQRVEEAQLREMELIEALEPFSRFELPPSLAVDMGTAVVVESNRGGNNHSILNVQHFRVAKKVLEREQAEPQPQRMP